jgi:cytochrome c553
LFASLILFLAAAAVTPVGAATLEERLAACLACHGEKGQSQIAEVPSLGAQPEFFLTAQLVMFRERLRVVEPMSSLLQGWSDSDLQQAAARLAKLPARQVDGIGLDTARAEKAQLIIQQHRCNFCHKADFTGADNAPRLAGQREDYLLKALRDYKREVRRAYDPSMADVLHPLSDSDFQDLAHYLSRLK